MPCPTGAVSPTCPYARRLSRDDIKPRPRSSARSCHQRRNESVCFSSNMNMAKCSLSTTNSQLRAVNDNQTIAIDELASRREWRRSLCLTPPSAQYAIVCPRRDRGRTSCPLLHFISASPACSSPSWPRPRSPATTFSFWAAPASMAPRSPRSCSIAVTGSPSWSGPRRTAAASKDLMLITSSPTP